MSHITKPYSGRGAFVADSFLQILDSIDALVYVADMETYEILFINQYGREKWGDVIGKICWQSLQTGQSGPCAYCTNNQLISTDGKLSPAIVLELQNTLNKKWYECHDRAIIWHDGRIVRLEIATDITKRKQLEQQQQKILHDLNERVKELNCFYGIGQIIEKTGITLEGICEDLICLLPASLQYPEITCGSILLQGREFKTTNFKETTWRLSSPITAYGKLCGELAIYYLDEKPEYDEGPFLKEERLLIDAVAERLGKITERKMADVEREKLIARLSEALENIKTLKGLIPICASCKKIRNDTGYWEQIEKYILEHSDVEFSHSICPECAKKIYPELYDANGKPKQ